MPRRVIVTRSLKHELRFDCLDDHSYDRLRFIDTRPSMPSVRLVPVVIAIERSGGRYTLRGAGIDSACAPDDLLDASHAIIRDVLIEEVRNGVLLHAASMNIGGRNLALLGEKGAGKTTLALKALNAGHSVFGDEHVFIDGATAMTRPRTLRVKEGSLELVPDLKARIHRCPFFTNWDGQKIFSLAPPNLAVNWRLRPYTIDHVIHILPSHQGPSQLREIDWVRVFPLAMEQSFLPPDNQGAALALLVKTLQRARIWQLALGDLDQALSTLRALP